MQYFACAEQLLVSLIIRDQCRYRHWKNNVSVDPSRAGIQNRMFK